MYVTCDDGSSTGWDFPSYGGGIPQDLCHLVVEDELGLAEGFWGLIDPGVDVVLVSNKATLMRHGKPLVEHVGVDFSGLNAAEADVAVLAGPTVDVTAYGELAVARLDTRSDRTVPTAEAVQALKFELPTSATLDAINRIHTRLSELGDRWRSLEDGNAIKLRFFLDGPPDRNGLPELQNPVIPNSPFSRRCGTCSAHDTEMVLVSGRGRVKDQIVMSSRTAIVSRISASTATPTLPRVEAIRPVDTARRC